MIHVIDDDPSFRKSLGRLLRAHGLQVETFSSAEEFQARSDLREPGCIILDINLGGMSGIELRRELAEPDGAGIPVVFVTASDSEALRKAAVEAGCVAFLQKPVPAKVLMDVVSETLAR
jgi:FixJ family two-component response regulator